MTPLKNPTQKPGNRLHTHRQISFDKSARNHTFWAIARRSAHSSAAGHEAYRGANATDLKIQDTLLAFAAV